MHAISPYTEFTRVASFPPDFGVTEQLSEFIEEESSSSSFSTSSSSNSSSTSSLAEQLCDCCDLQPILLVSEGWQDFIGGSVTFPARCTNMQGRYGGAFLLPFQGQGFGIARISCTEEEAVKFCLWQETVDLLVDLRWTVRFAILPDGRKIVEVAVSDETAGGFPGLFRVSARWVREVDDCVNLDVILDFNDYCECQETQPQLRCFCFSPFLGANQAYTEVLGNVTIHLTCNDEDEEEPSSASSQSPSSQSESSQSEQSASSPSSSTSSTSSQSLSSQSEQSSQSQSSSSSSTSTSSSSSAPGCGCCHPELPISDKVYVTINNLIQNGPCQEPCEETISPQPLGVCVELTRVDQCIWQGIGPQDAECFPVSFMQLELGCDGNVVTMTFTWTLAGDDVAVWQTQIIGQFINCDSCSSWELNPVFNARNCGTGSSWVEIGFSPHRNCCMHCPDHYQIQIAGVAENDESERCTDADCQQLNGVYLVHFLRSGATPTGACTDGLEDWCEYVQELGLRCTDAEYGFCSLHLFLKNDINCTTRIRVELRYDAVDLDDCNVIDERQGWQKNLVANEDVDCFNIDVTMDIQDLCLDANWNCLADPVTVRVTAPEVAGRMALTRLTPIGVPGRRYGA